MIDTKFKSCGELIDGGILSVTDGYRASKTSWAAPD